MEFDHENKIVKLCAEGIMTEGEGKILEAHQLYQQAWDSARTDFEKFTAAHYLARTQTEAGENLKWNNIALQHALAIDDEDVRACYPSLYLNVGKSYEDIADYLNAIQNYQLAKDHVKYLPADGFGNMLKAGIAAGIDRVVSTSPKL